MTITLHKFIIHNTTKMGKASKVWKFLHKSHQNKDKVIDHSNFRRINLLYVLLIDQGLSSLCVKFCSQYIYAGVRKDKSSVHIIIFWEKVLFECLRDFELKECFLDGLLDSRMTELSCLYSNLDYYWNKVWVHPPHLEYVFGEIHSGDLLKFNR